MPTPKLKFSIVIPAYREGEMIESTLSSVGSYLESEKLADNTEIIVVVADSDDETLVKCKKFSSSLKNFRVIEPGPKVGKGRDVRLGMLAARGEYILFMDADLSTPISHIKEVFAVLQKGGADIVIGQRNLFKAHKGMRLLGSLVSNVMIQILLLPGYKDTQCGFKAFRASVCNDLFQPLQTTGWGFDLEILVRAKSRNMRVEKLTVTDWSDSKSAQSGLVGESNAGAFYSTFKEFLRIVMRKLKGEYRAQ